MLEAYWENLSAADLKIAKKNFERSKENQKKWLAETRQKLFDVTMSAMDKNTEPYKKQKLLQEREELINLKLQIEDDVIEQTNDLEELEQLIKTKEKAERENRNNITNNSIREADKVLKNRR